MSTLPQNVHECRRTRRHYDTYLIALHKEDLLDEQLKAMIPASTLHSWLPRALSVSIIREEMHRRFAFVWICKNNNSLSKQLKALHATQKLTMKILLAAGGIKKVIENFKDEIISLVEKLKPHFKERHIFRYLPVSIQQFHYWVRTKTKVLLQPQGTLQAATPCPTARKRNKGSEKSSRSGGIPFLESDLNLLPDDQ